MTADGTYRPSTRVTTADELDALPDGTVVLDRDGEAWQRKEGLWSCTAASGEWRATKLAMFEPLHILFRSNEIPGGAPISQSVLDAWECRGCSGCPDCKGIVGSEWASGENDDAPDRPHPLRWSAEHGRPYVAGLPLDEVLAHWFEHVVNTIEPDEADPAVVSADYTRLRDALAARGDAATPTDPREVAHIECDCVPDLGPSHCHLCSTRQGREVPWSEAHPTPTVTAEQAWDEGFIAGSAEDHEDFVEDAENPYRGGEQP